MQQALQAVGTIALGGSRGSDARERRQLAAPARLLGVLSGAAGKFPTTDGALRHYVDPLA
ncbi:hypothetical protein CAter282_4418 [Collimonas arenae]|uniref:Uncharacterized protein n=1 Tax=Collimonas arenae TaxID=279058 RepID=A0A127PWK6_9BURK|nr:hypothetical protein CAter10_4799 [Collimonas arenae]AMP12078.1 hypothetical protein CAter282_4418 [Collimonas arenae]